MSDYSGGVGKNVATSTGVSSMFFPANSPSMVGGLALDVDLARGLENDRGFGGAREAPLFISLDFPPFTSCVGVTLLPEIETPTPTIHIGLPPFRDPSLRESLPIFTDYTPLSSSFIPLASN